MKNYLAILLALVMAVSLMGCSGNQEETVPTEPEVTAAPETEAPTEMVIDTEEKLDAALQYSGYVELGASLELTRHVVMSNDGVLDGCGNILTGPQYVEGVPATENGITMRSGRLKNITVRDAYRCIGDSKENPQTGNVRLENVTVDGPSYALNFGYGDFTGQLIADGSTFLGWSSYTGLDAATFTDCTFGWDSTGANGNLRPYVDTILIGCTFEGKTADDGSTVPFNISLRESISGITITLEDCYVGDTLLTQENVFELLNLELFENELYVSNSEG
ncbi:MAG: hypothetical protein IJO45_00330 [Oscillospiraceae bacterium]|nr:hypothetical protein [Oscillospiraceae bacterium]